MLGPGSDTAVPPAYPLSASQQTPLLQVPCSPFLAFVSSTKTYQQSPLHFIEYTGSHLPLQNQARPLALPQLPT